nr:hypothetical protein Iba_chr07eCG5340 [Ipomoea batatas]
MGTIGDGKRANTQSSGTAKIFLAEPQRFAAQNLHNYSPLSFFALLNFMPGESGLERAFDQSDYNFNCSQTATEALIGFLFLTWREDRGEGWRSAWKSLGRSYSMGCSECMYRSRSHRRRELNQLKTPSNLFSSLRVALVAAPIGNQFPSREKRVTAAASHLGPTPSLVGTNTKRRVEMELGIQWRLTGAVDSGPSFERLCQPGRQDLAMHCGDPRREGPVKRISTRGNLRPTLLHAFLAAGSLSFGIYMEFGTSPVLTSFLLSSLQHAQHRKVCASMIVERKSKGENPSTRNRTFIAKHGQTNFL